MLYGWTSRVSANRSWLARWRARKRFRLTSGSCDEGEDAPGTLSISFLGVSLIYRRESTLAKRCLSGVRVAPRYAQDGPVGERYEGEKLRGTFTMPCASRLQRRTQSISHAFHAGLHRWSDTRGTHRTFLNFALDREKHTDFPMQVQAAMEFGRATASFDGEECKFGELRSCAGLRWRTSRRARMSNMIVSDVCSYDGEP